MIVGIVADDLVTDFLLEHARKNRKAAFVETSACPLPIDCLFSDCRSDAHVRLF